MPPTLQPMLHELQHELHSLVGEQSRLEPGTLLPPTPDTEGDSLTLVDDQKAYKVRVKPARDGGGFTTDADMGAVLRVCSALVSGALPPAW